MQVICNGLNIEVIPNTNSFNICQISALSELRDISCLENADFSSFVKMYAPKVSMPYGWYHIHGFHIDWGYPFHFSRQMRWRKKAVYKIYCLFHFFVFVYTNIYTHNVCACVWEYRIISMSTMNFNKRCHRIRGHMTDTDSHSRNWFMVSPLPCVASVEESSMSCHFSRATLENTSTCYSKLF